MRVSGRVLLSVLLLVTSVTSILQSQDAHAAQITTRSLTLQTGAGGDGGSKPSGVVNHAFTFTAPGSTAIQSVKFEYCTTASVTACVAPAGMTATGATISGGGWSIGAVTPSATAPYITHSGTVNISAGVTFTLVGVTNPSATNSTFFVRITTYTSTDRSTGLTDSGSVAASTATQIVVTGTMPESIVFCTGAVISMVGSIPDCTTATAGSVTFNQLFSPTDTATATSQMAASTNAASGYVITVSGTSLVSGGNTIADAGGTATSVAGSRGTSKFGLNLVANTTAAATPAVGAAINPVSNIGLVLRGQATTDFGTADSFAYASGGSTIARSDYTSGGPFPTNGQKYTVSYFANVSGSQAAGSYAATLTYVCTATF